MKVKSNEIVDLDISVLNIKRDDVVVIYAAKELHCEEFSKGLECLSKKIGKCLGFEVPVVLLQSGVKIGIVDRSKLLAMAR